MGAPVLRALVQELAEAVRVLVVTSVFPNSRQPSLGVFVRERMFRLAESCALKVVAPVPWFPFAGFVRKGAAQSVPYLEVQDGIEVYHPRFLSIPGVFKCLDGFFFFFFSAPAVMRVRKGFDFDIIDAHFAYPDGLGAILLGKLFRRPVAITVRGTIRKLSRYALRKLQIGYALRSAAKVFAVCADLKEAAIEAGAPEGVIVIPNGIDIKKFRPMDRLAARAALGLPVDRKIIISVGGLVKRKGFHRVISCLPEIKKRVPAAMYLAVGGGSVEGDCGPELKRLAKELGVERDVVFAGQQAHGELYKWLSAADIFCLATSNEGWANVFLEAMACGLPVVTTRVGGNAEVVPDGDCGLLFDLEDAGAMKNAIVDALERDWDRNRIMEYAKVNTWEQRIMVLERELKKAAGPAMRAAVGKAAAS